MNAPCTNLTELFFSLDWDAQQEAKAICGGCLLRDNCLHTALHKGGFDRYVDGIEGGLDPQERGYYLRLFGDRPGQELPQRFRTKPPKSQARGAA